MSKSTKSPRAQTKPMLPLSRVMRISAANYSKFSVLKQAYATKNTIKHCTYDMFIAQLLSIAEALLNGTEVYRVEDRAFDDLADARGEAILHAIREKATPRMPDILIRIGTDLGMGDKNAHP